MDKEKSAKLVIISEVIFTLMPVLVVLGIKLYKKEFNDILNITDWSFLTIIFMGQVLIKFITGISANKNNKETNLVMLITTIIIVFGLIPPIIILVMISLSSTVPLCLYILQSIYFVISVVVYFIIGSISQILIENHKLVDKDFE